MLRCLSSKGRRGGWLPTRSSPHSELKNINIYTYNALMLPIQPKCCNHNNAPIWSHLSVFTLLDRRCAGATLWQRSKSLVHQLLPSLSEREKGASHLKYTIEADAWGFLLLSEPERLKRKQTRVSAGKAVDPDDKRSSIFILCVCSCFTKGFNLSQTTQRSIWH